MNKRPKKTLIFTKTVWRLEKSFSIPTYAFQVASIILRSDGEIVFIRHYTADTVQIKEATLNDPTLTFVPAQGSEYTFGINLEGIFYCLD